MGRFLLAVTVGRDIHENRIALYSDTCTRTIQQLSLQSSPSTGLSHPTQPVTATCYVDTVSSALVCVCVRVFMAGTHLMLRPVVLLFLALLWGDCGNAYSVSRLVGSSRAERSRAERRVTF